MHAYWHSLQLRHYSQVLCDLTRALSSFASIIFLANLDANYQEEVRLEPAKWRIDRIFAPGD
jgi:hypothetical protein